LFCRKGGKTTTRDPRCNYPEQIERKNNKPTVIWGRGLREEKGKNKRQKNGSHTKAIWGFLKGQAKKGNKKVGQGLKVRRKRAREKFPCLCWGGKGVNQCEMR